MRPRLGVFMSHPIQYQTSLMRHLATIAEIDLTVNYYWNFGVEPSFDSEFGDFVKWDLPLLSGYSSIFRRNFAYKPSTSFFGCINFGVVWPILSKDYDVVLIFGWALFSNWLVAISALLSNTPILLISETPMSHEAMKTGLRKVIRRFVLKFLFRITSKFLFIGKQNLDFYKSFDIPDTHLIFAPYGVDNERHLNYRNKPSKQDVNDGSVKILFVGKLIEKKRPIDLLLAFELLIKKLKSDQKLELWFVGDGVQKNVLVQMVEEREISGVTFWGFQNQTKLPEFYSKSDIFVLPSGYGETWGLVVNEAMCHAKPIIVSDLVGCGDDLVTNKNGFCVPFASPNAIADALTRLSSDPSLRLKFGEESKRIIKNYSQNCAAKTIAETALSVIVR